MAKAFSVSSDRQPAVQRQQGIHLRWDEDACRMLRSRLRCQQQAGGDTRSVDSKKGRKGLQEAAAAAATTRESERRAGVGVVPSVDRLQTRPDAIAIPHPLSASDTANTLSPCLSIRSGPCHQKAPSPESPIARRDHTFLPEAPRNRFPVSITCFAPLHDDDADAVISLSHQTDRQAILMRYATVTFLMYYAVGVLLFSLKSYSHVPFACTCTHVGNFFASTVSQSACLF